MRFPGRPIAALVALGILAFMTAPSLAGSWYGIRDKAMGYREKGQAAAAYSLVVGASPARGEDSFDRDFLAGWLALRSLHRPDVAVVHFKEMATESARLPKSKAPQGKAKAGYWLGRALRDLGRKSDAEAMFRASMAYTTSFYGQLSASELKLAVTKSQVSGKADAYPVKELYWHDSRARPEFVLAVIREESRFKQDSTSSKSARGMMQVMDGTARHVGKTAGVNIDIGLMRSNPDYNIAVGSRYLADQLERFGGNPMLAAAAYNAGPERVDEWIARFGDPRGGRADPVDWAESIPFRETREYVQKVISAYITYLALKG